MKRNTCIYLYADNTLSIFPLFMGILLSLLFVGCGTVVTQFVPKGAYEIPQLPKAELATIQIDTERQWIQRSKLIALHIDGKLALRKQLKPYGMISVDEILIAPGKRDVSIMTIYDSLHEGTRQTLQTVSKFSADIKTGGTYLLKDGIELVDVNTDKVVSQSKLF